MGQQQSNEQSDPTQQLPDVILVKIFLMWRQLLVDHDNVIWHRVHDLDFLHEERPDDPLPEGLAKDWRDLYQKKARYQLGAQIPFVRDRYQLCVQQGVDSIYDSPGLHVLVHSVDGSDLLAAMATANRRVNPEGPRGGPTFRYRARVLRSDRGAPLAYPKTTRKVIDVCCYSQDLVGNGDVAKSAAVVFVVARYRPDSLEAVRTLWDDLDPTLVRPYFLVAMHSSSDTLESDLQDEPFRFALANNMVYIDLAAARDMDAVQGLMYSIAAQAQAFTERPVVSR
ncbi:hypothetical protein PAPYR_3857 [Paratrimastix pyriformis]|uniref:Uncharacterized protein n=1 Tax=Paratrimastix pyriformis TaxID=342808 RepID=A0ABQ8UQ24_9EUKA|nr:hypothetical protein PAPYR_3857 [Paratrimastix pyriformis]